MDKTTVRIIPSLKRKADIYASTKGKTFQYVVNEALLKYLNEGEKSKNTTWIKMLKAKDLGKEKTSLQRKHLYKRENDFTR